MVNEKVVESRPVKMASVSVLGLIYTAYPQIKPAYFGSFTCSASSDPYEIGYLTYQNLMSFELSSANFVSVRLCRLR